MISSGIEVLETDRSVIRLWGEVDALLRDQASAALVRLLERGGPYVIDVAHVTFIDSAGLAFIIQLHRLAGDENTHVVLRDPPAFLVGLLDLIGVPGSIPFEYSSEPPPRQTPSS